MASAVFREQCGEFGVVGLRSDAVEVAIVPACGAKIVRLHDRRADREWTWSARPERKLFRSAVGDVFDDSPLIGIDECLPTVAPCSLNGSSLPDHGEVWPRGWRLDEEACNGSRVVTSISLKTAPLSFQRAVSVVGNTVRLDYTLRNDSSAPARYAWALHPLFDLREGDRIELPPGEYSGRVDSAADLNGLATDSSANWPEPIPGTRVDELLAGTQGTSLKLYLPTPDPAEFTVRNVRDGSILRGQYGPAESLPYLGIWVTRGGWNGYHHFAIEPTNVSDDRISRVDVVANAAALLGPGEEREWFVTLALG